LLFIYGLISGFTLNGIVSSLNIINSNKKSKSNKTLLGNIAHEVQKVVNLNQNYASYLGDGLAKFKEGRIAEFMGLQGELSICSRLVAAGKVVNGLGTHYDILGGSQEVDLTVKHNGQSFFIEIAASVSKLRDKISGGAQMQGYKDLVKKHI
jgi:hypothetical protein